MGYVRSMADDETRRVLRTDRLVLRPMAADDVDFVFDHFSNPHVHRYLVDSPPVTTRSDARSIVEDYTGPAGASHMRWVITDATSGAPIGTSGFHLWSRAHHRAEVGYDLAPGSWGQGVMSEALRAVLDHGFERLLLHRVVAYIHPDNAASLRLAERLGFVREGLARDLFLTGSTYHDHWMLALIAGELRPRA